MTWNSFEIDTDGKAISFMITVNDSLFIGAANDEGVTESIHELKQDKKTKEFKLKGGEIWCRRARTPLFERIALQFKDIVNFLGLAKESKEKIISILIDIALDLSKAEENFLEFLEIEAEATSRYQNPKGIKDQKHALVYKDPTVKLKGIAEKVIIRLIIAYRKLPEIVSIIRGKTIKSGKNFINELACLVPEDHPDRASFEYDNNWIKELYDIRGDIEHERWEVIPFEVNQPHEGDTCQVELCKIIIKSQGEKRISLAKFLDVAIYNMVTFIEEMVAISMVDKMPYPIRLVSVPESERSKRNHFKYITDLVPEVKENLPTK